MFDIACTAKALGDGYVLEALLPFKTRAAAALAVAERMDAGLASTVMGKLQYRKGYAEISRTAQTTNNLAFESGVRSQASVIRSTFLSVSALISQQLGDLSYTAVRSITLFRCASFRLASKTKLGRRQRV